MANNGAIAKFLLTPLREGRQKYLGNNKKYIHFYSRPCGRGDYTGRVYRRHSDQFLLTPLREGRPYRSSFCMSSSKFLLTPLREGRQVLFGPPSLSYQFLLTPLREGRPRTICMIPKKSLYFYSRPCGRGDCSW